MNRQTVLLAASLVLSASISLAADDSYPDFETIIIPVYYNGEGTDGAIWRTEFAVRNDGPVAIDSLEGGLYDSPTCPIAAPCPTDLPPHTTYFPPMGYYFSPCDKFGVLYYPRRTLAENLHFNLRIHDSTKVSSASGTEIPIVRQKDLRLGNLGLLNILNGPSLRLTLRIYTVRTGESFPVDVSVLDQETDQLLIQRQVVLDRSRCGGPAPEGWPEYYPAIAVLGHDFFLDPSLAAASRLRISIQALDPTLPIWAFISVVESDSGFLGVVSPQ